MRKVTKYCHCLQCRHLCQYNKGHPGQAPSWIIQINLYVALYIQGLAALLFSLFYRKFTLFIISHGAPSCMSCLWIPRTCEYCLSGFDMNIRQLLGTHSKPEQSFIPHNLASLFLFVWLPGVSQPRLYQLNTSAGRTVNCFPLSDFLLDCHKTIIREGLKKGQAWAFGWS